MYYIGKLAQATGLTILLIEFIRNFPKLMSHQALLLGTGFFLVGWIITKYLTKK